MSRHAPRSRPKLASSIFGCLLQFSTKLLYGTGILKQHVEAPDLATVKDFLRFHAATSKGKIKEKITCNSLNTFAEWLFAGFSRVADTPTNKDDRSEVYNVSVLRHMPSLFSSSVAGPKGLGGGKVSWSTSEGRSIFLPNAMLVAY